VTLAPSSQVVRGSDATKLKYKLTNIQVEHKMISSEFLGAEAISMYQAGKELACNHMMHQKPVSFERGADSRLKIQSRCSETVPERDPLAFHGALCRRCLGLGKIHLP